MAARMAAAFTPSYADALCILLPEELHAPVNEFRVAHDKGYERWPPHITLLFPFCTPEAAPAAIRVIERALCEAAIPPF